MHRFLYIILVFFGCTKDTPSLRYIPPSIGHLTIQELAWGFAQAQKLEEPWFSLPHAIYYRSDPDYKKVNIFFYVLNGNGFEREELSFGRVPLQPGRYELNKPRNEDGSLTMDGIPSGFATSQADGDVAGDLYRLCLQCLEPKNELVVEYYDISRGEIRGAFSGTYIRDTTNKAPVYPEDPDTVVFTEGIFLTKIVK